MQVDILLNQKFNLWFNGTVMPEDAMG